MKSKGGQKWHLEEDEEGQEYVVEDVWVEDNQGVDEDDEEMENVGRELVLGCKA